MTGWNLTREDVVRLLEDSSEQTRVDTARKISTDFNAGDLTLSERELVQDIFRIMVHDAEIRVREALAIHLKETTDLPRDVAQALAADVESVALPILQYSEVLTDDDLIHIIGSRDQAKQVAIASRKTVSETVSSALVDTKSEEVVSALVANEGAQISEPTLTKVVEHFPDSTKVQNSMVRRAKLPITVVERLVSMLAENLKEELIKHQDLPTDFATDLVLQARELAIVSLSVETTGDDLGRLVEGLAKNGRLTPSLIVRALCMGDLAFFETALAVLANVPVKNARALIHDTGQLGLRAIYKKSRLPEGQFAAVRAAVDVIQETQYDGGERDRERFSRRMIERMVTQCGDLGVRFEPDDLTYLLSKMSTLPARYAVMART